MPSLIIRSNIHHLHSGAKTTKKKKLSISQEERWALAIT